MIPYLMISGYSDSGKTLVTSTLIAILTRRGYRSAAIKHAHEGYEVDAPEKDSWHFFNNGAREVVVASPRSYFIHRRVETEPDLDELLTAIRDVDIILVEGFKQHAGPKILVYRQGYSSDRLPVTAEVLAVVSEPKSEEKVPCFGFDQLEQLAELIIISLLKNPV